MGKKSFVVDYSDFPFLERLLKEKLTGSVLDIGCFRGCLAGIIGTNSVTGVDIEPECISECVYRQKFVASASNLPFEGSSFDSIFSGYTFSYVENKPGFLSEARRVLKDRGTFLIASHHPNDSKFEINARFVSDFEKFSCKKGSAFYRNCLALFELFGGELAGLDDALAEQFKHSKKFLALNSFSSVDEFIEFFNSHGFVAKSHFSLFLDFRIKPMEKLSFFEKNAEAKQNFYFSSPIPLKLLYGHNGRKMVFFELVKGNSQPHLNKSDFCGKTMSGRMFKVVNFS